MTSNEIGLLRLQNQCVSGRHMSSPEAVVEHMAAMQAQDYYNALWTLGVRTGATEQQILHTLEARTVIRTWPQRGTLHFVAAQNAAWQVSLSADRQIKRAATRQKNLGLDDAIFVQSQKILTQALRERNYLTRPQALALLEDNNILTKDGRGYHILWHLAQRGVIYIGPMQSKQQTVGLLSALVPKPNIYNHQEGVARLAKQYFVSHGPATLQDFMWWAGITMTDARAGLAANKHLLSSVELGDKTYWLAGDSTLRRTPDEAFLLPAFDEFLLGYKDRSDVLAPEHAAKVSPGGNGMFFPMIVIRGTIVGTWKRTLKKNHLLLRLTPFEVLSKTDRDLLEKPAQNYSAFLGLPFELEFVEPV